MELTDQQTFFPPKLYHNSTRALRNSTRSSFSPSSSVLGYRLNSREYKRFNALTGMDCAAQCFREFCCRSANFNKKSNFHETREINFIFPSIHVLLCLLYLKKLALLPYKNRSIHDNRHMWDYRFYISGGNIDTHGGDWASFEHLLRYYYLK